jgi:tetratricopeptide (TPR) repeat protein
MKPRTVLSALLLMVHVTCYASYCENKLNSTYEKHTQRLATEENAVVEFEVEEHTEALLRVGNLLRQELEKIPEDCHHDPVYLLLQSKAYFPDYMKTFLAVEDGLRIAPDSLLLRLERFKLGTAILRLYSDYEFGMADIRTEKKILLEYLKEPEQRKNILSYYAEYEMSVENYDEANKALAEAIELAPEDPRVISLQANIELLNSNYKLALDLLTLRFDGNEDGLEPWFASPLAISVSVQAGCHLGAPLEDIDGFLGVLYQHAPSYVLNDFYFKEAVKSRSICRG